MKFNQGCGALILLLLCNPALFPGVDSQGHIFQNYDCKIPQPQPLQSLEHAFCTRFMSHWVCVSHFRSGFIYLFLFFHQIKHNEVFDRCLGKTWRKTCNCLKGDCSIVQLNIVSGWCEGLTDRVDWFVSGNSLWTAEALGSVEYNPKSWNKFGELDDMGLSKWTNSLAMLRFDGGLARSAVPAVPAQCNPMGYLGCGPVRICSTSYFDFIWANVFIEHSSGALHICNQVIAGE